MSRDRCHSLDRVQRRGLFPAEVSDPQRSPSAPNTYFRHYVAANGNGSSEYRCDGDNSIKFLEDLEDPQFCDLPPDSSFDEVRCIMATPPHKTQPAASTAAKNLDELRSELAEVIQVDELREVNLQNSPVQIDNVPKEVISNSTATLPKDLHAIPPPPKNPKDVVAFIKRAKAIARIKELENKQAALKQPKVTIKQALTGLNAGKKIPRKVPTSPKLKEVSSNQTSTTKHPTDYVQGDCIAILRARKLAGVKTSPPKISPKLKVVQIPPATKPKSPLRQTIPPSPKIPTFENILQQISAIRLRTDVAKPVFSEKKQEESAELDEFEVLEELYGAVKADQRPPTQQSIFDLRKRINMLQQQVLQSPILMEPMAQELEEFEALERQHGDATFFERHTPQQFKIDLQDRINTLKESLFQTPTRGQNRIYELPSILRYEGLQQGKEIMEAAAATARLPTAAPPQYSSSNAVPLHTHEMSEFAFPIEALTDAEGNAALDHITMPDFDADISFDEFGIADISSPDLCDLSTSGYNMALEPDFIRELSVKDQDDDDVTGNVVAEEISEQPGILTSVINAIVDRLKNIFSTSKDANAQNVADTESELDTSLPNMFEITPPTESGMPKSPRPQQTISENPAVQEPITSGVAIAILPQPKDPKNYMTMIKRAHDIQKKKIEETQSSTSSLTKGKRAALQKKTRSEKPQKVYPAGEYSPSYTKAVARARSLAGLKNLSTLLNPERAAKMAQQKAAREAKLKAIEALPAVERIREKMRSMRRDIGSLPKPSIEVLATLEAIRERLPKFEVKSQQTKWQPADGLRVDRCMKPFERRLSHETTQKKTNWKKMSIMSPILEEPELKADLIQFSPLKPHEARMRLAYLKDQAAKQTINTLRDLEESQVEIKTSSSRPTGNHNTTPISPMKLSPICLYSPSSPRTEETRRGANMTAEVAEISTIQNASSTRQVLAKSDEYGNVTNSVKERTDLSREEEDADFSDDLANMEPPDFFETLDMTFARDPSIPTTNEIKGIVAFPKVLPDENLFDIRTPEFEITPKNVSPQLKSISPFEKDTRMYALGEHPSTTLTTRVPTSIVAPASSEQAEHITSIPITKSAEDTICVPQHLKNPKDYRAMIKRAQAIPMLRAKDSERTQNQRLVLPKRVPKLSPKQIKHQQRYDMEYLSKLPTLPEKYREAVARARLLRGLKNKSAALNPALAAKIAKEKVDEEAAKAAYDSLPEVEKLKLRIEKLRRNSSKQTIKPFADLHGTLASTSANMPQKEFTYLTAQCESEASLKKIEALEAESKKLYNLDTPKRSKRHGQRRLIREFSPMSNTPPKNIQERFQRLKEVQEKQEIPSEYAAEELASPAISAVVYSPIKIVSPSYFLAEENDETPRRVVRPRKQFEDLEDMPFDKLEYEIEPAFTDVSLVNTTLSPPPRPSDIIGRIKSKLKVVTHHPALKSPPMLKFPQELPEEELVDLSAPSLVQTPSIPPQKKLESPRVSLPMAWWEAQSATLVTTDNLVAHIPTKKQITTLPQEVFDKKVLTPDSLIGIPAHPKDRKNYAAMIRRSRAIHKVKKQKEVEEAATAPQSPKSDRNYHRPLILRKRVKESGKVECKKKALPLNEKKECSAEPPPLPQEYRDAVAKSRLLHGLTNRTAALNPEIAAKEAAKQTYNALPKIEKIRTRIERLRENPSRRRHVKPTIEQIAFLEALKLMGEFQTSSPEPFAKIPTALPLSKTPESTVLVRSLSITPPRANSKQISEAESRALAELAEFEALEQLDEAAHSSPTSTQNLNSKQRITELRKLLEAECISRLGNKSLAEFEHLKNPQALDRQFEQHATSFNIKQLISDLRQQLLVTPPTVKTPEIHYTPITLPSSPDNEESKKLAAKVTTHVENLRDIQEPTYLELTPSPLMERPRPRDIIERVREQVKKRFRPEVPTGHLIELRTPPRILPLPTKVPEENLLDLSYPSFQNTPQSLEQSPVKSPNISLPQVFLPTPPSTPPLTSLSPLKHSTPSPKNPEDYKELVQQNEAELQAVKEAEAAKLMKTDRVPISKFRKPNKDKMLVMKKRGKLTYTKAPARTKEKCSPPLPEYFKKEVVTARELPDLKSRTAELNSTPEQGDDAMLKAKRSPIRNYAKVWSRMKDLREKIVLLRGETSLTSYHNDPTDKMQFPISNIHEFNLAAFDSLSELEELSKIEQPSYVDISDQYLSITPPQTPPPEPSAIIERIRQQYYQNNAVTSQEKPMPTPVYLEFPEGLPEEQIFELSAPSFTETPVKLPTPITTPNISLPQYFEDSPLRASENILISKSTIPRKSSTPKADLIDTNLNLKSPFLPGVCPGIKVKTPQGQIIIPPHLKDSKDVAAMTRRAQLIQNVLSKSADKEAASKLRKGRVPLSRKVPTKKNEPKKKESKTATTRTAMEYPTEKLPTKDQEAIAEARKLADFKNASAFFQSKGAVKQPIMDDGQPTSYASIMEKIAALRAKYKIQVAASARELTYKQHLINRHQRLQRKRLLRELEQLRQQQSWEFQPLNTPTPVGQRFKAIKSRISAEATTSSAYPYSPVKTPEDVDLPQFQPLTLSQTPPYPFLDNVSITDIADMSMQLDDLDNYSLDHGTENEEDLEFELAEIANEAYEFGENIDVAELNRAEDAFNIAERIQMLQQQLLKSSDVID